ncbi:MAG TPA: dethiobiotin synthase [Gammaproteobacteria bacterium]|nr:dethiobiotin synthase [Gammaproteobacteria bacterium]
MKNCYFVSGTDTGVGKTWISAALLHAFHAMGVDAVGMKPVASGCEQTPEGLRNSDALILQQSASRSLSYDLINPFAFKPAIAPHLAATAAGQEISTDILLGRLQQFKRQVRDVGLIEGAGGWQVPLNATETWKEFVQAANLPVILVVGLRLGCINHALLTAESITAAGVPVAGWVANRIDPRMENWQENIETIRDRLVAPMLGNVPYLDSFQPTKIANNLDLLLLKRALLN